MSRRSASAKVGLAQAGHLSPFTRYFFLTNNHTPRDTNPRTRATAAQARGPTDTHFVVANVNAGSGTRNRRADKIKNITALMMNESGSIRLPLGISRHLFSTSQPVNISTLLLAAIVECLGRVAQTSFPQNE